MQGRKHEVGTQRTSASRRLQRRLHLRVAAGTGGRRLGACGAGSACESRPAKKAAVKGRWAGVPIDPFAYGSGTSEFALRNLHKSPDCRVGAGRTCGRPRAVGALDLRRLVQVSCGWPRVGCLRDLQAPGGARRRRPTCTFFEVRCSLVGKIAVRAHFLRFVAALRRTSRAHHGGDFAKSQVRTMMLFLVIFLSAAETGRFPS